MKEGWNKVATLDLSKSYDKVNRSDLFKDCEHIFGKELVNMLRACLQTFKVTRKVDVLDKEAILRLGLA